MTNTAMSLLLLSLFLLSMTTIAALHGVTLLATTNAIMMMCVPLLGAATVTAFGYSSNVGNIFFATVMYGLSLKLILYGAAEAQEAVNNVLFALVIVFGSIFLLQEAHVLSPLFGTRVRIVGASFVSFWLVQSFFIILLERHAARQSILRVPLITIAMQALDSAVFFPCAFAGDLPAGEVMQFALIGWLTKSAIAALSIPFLLCIPRPVQTNAAAKS